MSGITLKIDFSKLNQRFSTANLNRAQYIAKNEAMNAMEQFVPRDQGDLRNLARKATVNTQTEIIYPVPYAKAQFYGGYITSSGKRVEFTNYTTPGTGKRWDLRLKGDRQRMSNVKRAYIKALRGDA